MGMYTEFHFNCELKPETPESVLEVLRYMLLPAGGKTQTRPAGAAGHPLFETQRWSWMLLCSSDYFPSQTRSELIRDNLYMEKNKNRLWLNIKCNLKNYDDEIEKFLDWVKPWVDKGCDESEPTFFGFYRYESDNNPTLIYL